MFNLIQKWFSTLSCINIKTHIDNDVQNINSGYILKDPTLKQIVADIRNYKELNEAQLIYLKSRNKDDLLHIIRLLNFCNYTLTQNYIDEIQINSPILITKNTMNNTQRKL